MSWKVVAAGEVLSVPRLGAGALLRQAQVHLETADVLAVTSMLVFVSWLIQKIAAYIHSLHFPSKNLKSKI